MNLLTKIQRFFMLLQFVSGRNELQFRIQNFFWPVLYPLASFYRKLFLKNVKLIVVIGSLGKTTITKTIQTILGETPKNQFESNAFSALAKSVFCISSQKKYVVLEVGIAKQGDMLKYAKMLQPNIVVVTAISSDHSNNLGEIINIAKEKSKIFSGKTPELIVYNGDDENVIKMVEPVKTRKISYGYQQQNQICIKKTILNWPSSTTCFIQSENGVGKFNISLFGEKMAYCFAAAFAIAQALKMPEKTIIERAKKIKPANGRMQIIHLQNNVILIKDDFKTSSESFYASLQFLAEIPSSKKIVLMGAVSHIQKKLRKVYQNFGKNVALVADQAFIVHSKDFEQAFSATAKKNGLAKVVKMKNSWQGVFDIIKPELNPGTVILIKGKREQKFERLSLQLMGRKVGCKINKCPLKYVYCKDCSKLETGW